jgi:hypothetical protein
LTRSQLFPYLDGRMRPIALSLAVAAFMAATIGPGVSLVRCLLTGEVHLSCCCGERDAASSPEQLEATDDCCQFTHLDASWQRSSLFSHFDLAEPLLSVASDWHPLPLLAPPSTTSRALVSHATSPPLFLSTKSIRV